MVSIVIPCFNERFNILSTIKNILISIENANINFEYEIIIVDSSTDDTFSLIEKSDYYSNEKCRFVHSEEILFPGAGRNLGIKKSKYDIIVFVDSGFSFDERWFENLIEPLIDNCNIDIVWGTTETSRINNKDRMFAHLIESKSQKRRVLPNCAIRKKIFNDGNWFEKNLRAVEDTKFIEQIKDKYNEIFVNAKNYYSGHPETLAKAFKKWSTYTYYSIKAGRVKKARKAIFQMAIYILIIFVLNVKWSLFLILILQNIRVLIKSNKKYRVKFYEYPYILMLSFFIDFGRLYGSIRAYKKKWLNQNL